LADIHIVREHGLGLEQARRLALRWAQLAERKLDMECVYEEGKAADVVRFRRSGAHGELQVTGERFDLRARLGLLLGAFKSRIEAEIAKNLDELLAAGDPVHALDHRVARHEGRHAGKPAAPKPAAKRPHGEGAKARKTK
jgi:putative polyhydroxyalkanoate system protein